MKFVHRVITRFGLGVFSEDWYRHRFALLEAITMPSVLGQTCKDFEWILILDSEAPNFVFKKMDELASLDSRIKYVKRSPIIEDSIPGDVRELSDFDADFVLTSRIDDDDAIALDTYAIVHEKAKRAIDAGSVKGVLATFRDGYEVDLIKGRFAEYSHPSHSMAIHLLLPSAVKSNCYSFSHTKIAKKDVLFYDWQHFECSSLVAERSWLYIRHAQVDSRLNKVRKGHVEITDEVAVEWQEKFGVDPDKLLKYMADAHAVESINHQSYTESGILTELNLRTKNGRPLNTFNATFPRRLRNFKRNQNCMN